VPKTFSSSRGADHGNTPSSSKKLVPMADALVRDQSSAEIAAQEPANQQAQPAADEESGGFWDSVTSFFSGSEASEETENVDKTVQETAVAVQPESADELVVGRTEEVVSDTVDVVEERAAVETAALDKSAEETVSAEDRAPAADETASQASTQESEEESGFWSSITSIFSSDDEPEETAENQPATQVGAQTATTADSSGGQTGKDELPPDAGVLAMIEQIEGPPPRPEAKTPDTDEVVVGKSKEEKAEVEQSVDTAVEQVAQQEENRTVIAGTQSGKTAEPAAVQAEPGEEQTVQEQVAEEPTGPVKGSSVSDMIAQIESDVQAPLKVAEGAVYGVETPEQARAKQQMLIDRLLDDERCVACDLAGVDLAGKNLDGVDLERANLQGARLAGIDLGEANLKGVDFSGADLKGADLREADLYKANFSGADLTGAKLEGALIDSADFDGAVGVNLEGAVRDE
jgi:hypothetical protein